MGRLRILGTILVVAGATLWGAPAAEATFHKMSIREVYPGGPSDASYVELQMWDSGQTSVKGHHLVAYDTAGNVVDNFALPANVANGANQSTILVADTNYPLVFDDGRRPTQATKTSISRRPVGRSAGSMVRRPTASPGAPSPVPSPPMSRR